VLSIVVNLVLSKDLSAGELCLVGKAIVPSFKTEDLWSFMVPHRDNLPPFPPHAIHELNLFAGQLYFPSGQLTRMTRNVECSGSI